MVGMRSIAALVALVSSAAAQFVSTLPDIGNGVHVPGAVPANPYEPLQHRLAYAGEGGMAVLWNTFAELENPQVRYGKTPGKLDQIANSSISRTYPTARTWTNVVKIHNLEPATKYYYKVSYTNCAYCAYMPLYTFTTARQAGDHTPFTAAMVADLGLMGHDGLSTMSPTGVKAQLGANETNTIQSMLELKDTYEFICHQGDLGYADYFLKESYQKVFGSSLAATIPANKSVIENAYESMNEQWYDQMQPISAEKPWMVLPGNHEANCNNGGTVDKVNNITYDVTNCTYGQTNFTGYSDHFLMPSYESGGRGNFWYSFDYGMAHFVHLDTETDLGHNLEGPIEDDNGPFGALMNEQVNWLRSDLQKVDREKTPWVVVGLHRPWYVSVDPPTYPAWQEAFEQIMYDGNVDLYLQGHVHIYERFTPTFNGTIDPNGLNNPRAPWIILNGAGGHYDGLDELPTDGTRANGSMVAEDDTFSWGRLVFHNRTHLTYEAIASKNGSVFDSATLFKEHDF